MTFTAGCSHKDGKDLVLVEEIKQPAIINEYKLSAGIKAEAGSYYEIQEGTLKGYGINQCGQLGIRTIDDIGTYYENPVTIAEHVVHVDTLGGDFAIYLNNKNELYGMGRNDSGQLGQSIEGKNRLSYECYVSEPVRIMEKINYIACGLYTAAAIRNDGTLFMWGDNSFGEIGNRTKGNEMPTVSTYVVFEPFKLMEKIKDVRFDNFTVYATTFSGDLYIWGKGYSAHPSKIENWY
jgi:alpha-tubulin suppressor-like RCC1 family protein